MADAQKYTIKALKEKLSALGLTMSGNKGELLLRLSQTPEVDMATLQTGNESAEQTTEDTHEGAASMLQMIDIYRREKEAAERELRITRQELDLARREKALSETESTGNAPTPPVTSTAPMVQAPMRITDMRIADLLNWFDGDAETYEIWERQVRYIRNTYQLDDNATRNLISKERE